MNTENTQEAYVVYYTENEKGFTFLRLVRNYTEVFKQRRIDSQRTLRPQNEKMSRNFYESKRIANFVMKLSVRHGSGLTEVLKLSQDAQYITLVANEKKLQSQLQPTEHEQWLKELEEAEVPEIDSFELLRQARSEQKKEKLTAKDFAHAKEKNIPKEEVIRRVQFGMSIQAAINTAYVKPLPKPEKRKPNSREYRRAKELGIPREVVNRRLEKNWSLERAISIRWDPEPLTAEHFRIAEENNIPRAHVKNRYKSGWAIERCITEPIRSKNVHYPQKEEVK